MRFALVTVLVSGWLGVGHAQAPPSASLERAVQLYDRKAFVEASLAFHEITQTSAGTPEELQRAEFFLGKTLVALGYPVAGLAIFDKIMLSPQHRYRDAIAKWIAAIGDETSHPSVFGMMQLLRADGNLQLHDDATQAAIAYYAGRDVAHRDPSAALGIFESVRAGTKPYARARLAMTLLRLQQKDMPNAIEAVFDTLDDPEVAVDGVVELDAWTRRLAIVEEGDDTLSELAKRGDAMHARYAALATQRRMLERSHRLDAVPAVRTWNAVVFATSCGRKTDDLAQAASLTARLAAERIGELVKKYDDNAEMYDAMQKLLRGRDDASLAMLMRIALDDPSTREQARFERELGDELETMQHADKAWQTTMIAAEILQELVVQRSIAQADLGKRFRMRMVEIERELREIDVSFTRSKERIVVSDKPTLNGFVITDTMCSMAIGKRVSSGAIATSTTPTLPAAAQPRGNGCAGCASANGSNLSSGIAGAIALGFVVLRRRRRA